jgi:hypothetical protein
MSQKIINILFLFSLALNAYFVALKEPDSVIDDSITLELKLAYEDSKKAAIKDSLRVVVIDSMRVDKDKQVNYIRYLERNKKIYEKEYSNFNNVDRNNHLDSIFTNRS